MKTKLSIILGLIAFCTVSNGYAQTTPPLCEIKNLGTERSTSTSQNIELPALISQGYTFLDNNEALGWAVFIEKREVAHFIPTWSGVRASNFRFQQAVEKCKELESRQKCSCNY